MSDYAAFLESKRLVVPNAGKTVTSAELNPQLFPFQRDLVRWSLKKGRAALFASTGLGKTLMELQWGQLAAPRTLVLTPLAVARQTVREGEKFGIPATYARHQEEAPPTGITVTNYEMVLNGHFDPAAFGAVVLDESSCLKDHTTARKVQLTALFRRTPYRLAATATPAPNDIDEIANHADFLGIMTRQEVIAAFFVNRSAGRDLQLKRHGREAFFRWLASWGMSLNRPGELGYDDTGYTLPPLTILPLFIETDYVPEGRLFALGLDGVTERAQVRRNTAPARVAAAVRIIEAEPDEPWLIWCGLNAESEAMTKAIPGAVEVAGSDDPETKAARLTAFAEGQTRVLITKAGIAGWGMNFQHCARVLFLGMNESFETWFQAIRRCWRYGQTRPVTVHVVLSEPERVIYENVLRKEREAVAMSHELVRHVAAFERDELGKSEARPVYRAGEPMEIPAWMKSKGPGDRGQGRCPADDLIIPKGYLP